MADEKKTETKPTDNKEPKGYQSAPWKGKPAWLYRSASDKDAILCATEAEYSAALKAGAKDTWTPEAWK